MINIFYETILRMIINIMMVADSIVPFSESLNSFQNEDWRYVVEKEYLPLIANCKIDYIDDIFKGGFKFLNPQATGTCGCAASFTTDTDRKFINNVLTKDNK